MATTQESTARNEKEILIGAVKKEVKQIMEEAVTRKFVHEESSSITSLCAVVEECLRNGLKKRALGLFKNSTTMALLQKISKLFEPAAHIVKLVTDFENNQENKKSFDSNRNLSLRTGWTNTSTKKRYMWIRLALFEKVLAEVIEYLVQSANKYYDKEALMSDPVHGPILASLLGGGLSGQISSLSTLSHIVSCSPFSPACRLIFVLKKVFMPFGPCALEFTKMKTPDHYWTDPPADELVQRHRIHSNTNHHIRATSPKRPGLQVQVKSQTSSSSEDSLRTGPLSAKDYVESLHQNCKSTLLYGKNNVIVQPKEDVEPLAGYLSLHQGFDGLCLKWTPNQLMNGCCEEEDEQTIDRRPIYARYFGSVHRNSNQRTKLLYWDYAVKVYLDEIVYLHCHQQPDRGGTIVLVGQDGVQRPPIHFPKGGHLLAFLSCLENGLLPHGQLDPPLWTQRGKGKVFPKLRRKGSRMSNLSSGSQTSDSSSSVSIDDAASLQTDEEETTDYVFRIITTFRPDNIPTEMLDPKVKGHLGLTSGRIGGYLWPTRETAEPPPTTTVESTASSTIQSYAQTQQEFNHSCICRTGHRSAVKQLCDTMTKQIRSRAFYGWLSHCRHLKTVRTHLSGLVNATIMLVDEPRDASKGLTMELWKEMNHNDIVNESKDLYRLVYYGGCAHDARKQVWPYLLGHYKFGQTAAERQETDESQRCQYEQTMSEWLAVEAIVRQRDKEAMAANLVKVSSGSQDGHIPLMRKDSNLSNDVFMSVESDDYVPPETLPEESSNATSSPDGDAANSVIDVATRGSESALDGMGDGTRTKSVSDEGLGDSIAHPSSSTSGSKRSDSSNTDRNMDSLKSESDDSAVCGEMMKQKNIIVTGATVDMEDHGWEDGVNGVEVGAKGGDKERLKSDEGDQLRASKESLVLPPSPASVASNGGVYSAELLDNMTVNLHRIDKDVQRCDRNYCYFTTPNLDKLRNIMCTYVWENLDVGYIQGMCDLVAPLLVIFDDEAMTYSCFCHLMKRMSSNFPHGGAMDQHFANMRSLIQILDPELFEHMHQNGDYTHFYFCYRWFLLDFKRELVYDDVFAVWETIWAARHISSPHFVLFIALALVEYYREIIIDNNMDFTDIIKFFNEMAERHNVKQVLRLARDLVHKLQDLIDNK